MDLRLTCTIKQFTEASMASATAMNQHVSAFSDCEKSKVRLAPGKNEAFGKAVMCTSCETSLMLQAGLIWKQVEA